MNFLNSIVSKLPVTSDVLKYGSVVCAGITLTSFITSDSSALKWGSAFATAAVLGVMSVKAEQEKTKPPKPTSQEFVTQFLKAVVECIDSSNNSFTPDVRVKMKQIIEQLEQHGFYIQEGNDDFRAPFVGTQGAIEHIIAAQKTLGLVTCILGAVHTPTPATPLCVAVDGKNIDNLIAPSLQHDPDKMKTITDRALSIRRMLAQKDTVLYALYPQGGLQKRKEPEQAIFLAEVQKQNGKLIAKEFTCKEMDPSCVGAIYFVEDAAGNKYAFSIKAQQANNPQERSTWGIWFGVLQNDEIKHRVQEVSTNIKFLGGPDLPEEFLSMCMHKVLPPR